MQENASSGPVSADGPTTAGANDGREHANRKAIEKLLNDYFSKQHDRNLREHLKAKLTTVILRWVVGATGVALFAAPIIRVILTEETDRQILGQTDGLVFLLPGLVLMTMAFIAALWSRGWPAPMLLAIAIAAFDVFYFDTGPALLIPFMIGVAAIAFGGAVLAYFSQGRAEPKSLAELESEIDQLTVAQFREFVREARSHLPMPPGRLVGAHVHYLKCFPKRERLNQPDILARIGTDQMPRMSPIGICAFDLGESDVIVLEGAVDLKTGDPVYLSAHQFAYHDISAVIWGSDVWPTAGAGTSSRQGASSAAENLPQQSQQVGAGDGGDASRSGRGHGKPPVLRLEEFKILLKSTHAVEIVFHDGSLGGRLKDRDFFRIEDTSKIRAVWERLANKRASAQP